MNRREAIKASSFLSAAFLLKPDLIGADQENEHRFKIGACDWSIKMPLGVDSFHFAKHNGLDGIQYSFDAAGNGLDLRTLENPNTIRATVKETEVAISSLGIGLLNKIPFATTDEGEKLVVECIDTMSKLKQEASELEDRDLPAKVSPGIALLAFFNKADIKGKPDSIEKVIEKLKRVGPYPKEEMAAEFPLKQKLPHYPRPLT